LQFNRPDRSLLKETSMDKRLHQLETLRLRGDDGRDYVVHGFEHLARLDAAPGVGGDWEPTGESEYRLADGRPVAVDADGVMTIAQNGVRLTQPVSSTA
jgi:hypothetical protein